ncbi:MAG: DUF1598 domain-containing protein [Pirellulales bacterium]|nr:DUF1598 domain-containing protein [Pirellulales bacterium]
MSIRDLAVTRSARRAAFVLALAWAATFGSSAYAQIVDTGNDVGGVFIGADNILRNSEFDNQGRLRAIRDLALDPVPGDLTEKSDLRKVSLRLLEEAIQTRVQGKEELPESILFLAGLQQVRYVLVYPEQNDIVLVGPAEGWKLNPRGAVVGKTTGRPVLMLDDLLVALRTAAGSTRSAISCSIDPTEEGLQRVSAHARKLRTIGNPQATAMGIEEQLGPQRISVNGVPETSHFARVMVAADYRMKRVSMGLEPAPVQGLPSFLEMMKAGGQGMSNMLPRWWLAPDYQPLLRDADGLAWELRGASVKAMAESDFLAADGTRQQGGKADPVSQRWADLLTQRYSDLSMADPVFGQLRNCMDLAVVAALVAKESLTQKVNCELPMLAGSSGVPTVELNAPKQVDSKASLVNKGRKWMIAAGGVSINPWAIIENVEQTDQLADVRAKAGTSASKNWWWD